MITSAWSQPGQAHPAAEAIYQEVLVQELGLPQEAVETAGAMSLHLVLELDGEPVAAGALAYVSARQGRIAPVCVRKRWRLQGIGDGLVKILNYKAGTLGFQTATADVPEAHLGFFRRLGYAETGEEAQCGELPLKIMEKELDDDAGDHCTHQCAGEKG